MTTKCNVVFWIGFWNRKNTKIKKLRKCEYSMDFNDTISI